MTREEFYENVKTISEKEENKLQKPAINAAMWKDIEKVYLFHPSISSSSGKEDIAFIYYKFGMAVIRDMLPRAKKSEMMEKKLQLLNQERKNVLESMEQIATGTELENKYYFTFGSSSQFPYQNGYIVVIAEDRHDAVTKYRVKYPDHTEDTINCSEIYSEEEWYSCKGNHYYNREPYEIIE